MNNSLLDNIAHILNIEVNGEREATEFSEGHEIFGWRKNRDVITNIHSTNDSF